jgi:formylglycine-generating enzyme required for sulfatase activity
MAWACECGCSVPEDDSVCGDCGRRRVSDPEALATYEAILVELASDGVVDEAELRELGALRAELGVAFSDHEALMARHAPSEQALPLALAVDEATLRGFLAGRAGFVRVRVDNGGSRMLRNVTVRYAVSGEDAMREHVVKMLRPGVPDAFGATVELPRGGQYMLELVVYAEDMLGKVRQAYRADPVGFSVGESTGASGPSTVVVNTTVEAGAMRVAGEALASVNVGGPAGAHGPRAGALSDEAWRRVMLRSITQDEWAAWAVKRDAQARATMEAAALRARKEAAAREATPAGLAQQLGFVWTEMFRALTRLGAPYQDSKARAIVERRFALTAWRREAELVTLELGGSPCHFVLPVHPGAWECGTPIRDLFRVDDTLPLGQPPVVKAAAYRHNASGLSTPGQVTLGHVVSARPAWMSACGEDTHGRWAEAEVAGVTFRFRYCPAGTFQMGSPSSEKGRDDDERQHEVQLTKGFWLGATPVTQRQWEAVTGENPSYFKGPDRPVEEVSWEDCVAFLGKLNARCPGLDLRLPTEAEWEYACRAGTTGPTYLGSSDAATLDRLGWYDGNSGDETHPVGQKAPNAWGLYDTLGNVYEWCADWKADYPAGRQVDPKGPSTGTDRVIRGGDWSSDASYLRAANRAGYSPGYRSTNIGFRVARSSP